MRKLPSVTLDERPRTRRRRIVVFLVLTLLLVLSPILYETTIVTVAGWQGLFGVHPQTHTPVLDVLGDLYHTASFDAKAWTRGVFNRTPWKSSIVIPFAIFWTAALSMLLRRC